MSQAKVDYYKEQKKNRREIMRKEKSRKRLEITALIVILAAVIGWFGYMVYQNVTASAAASGDRTELDLTALEEYMNNLEGMVAGEEEEAEEGEHEHEHAGEEAEAQE